jgi:hypothetical protein
MKSICGRQFAGKVLILIWAILSISLFISIPGKVSYIQWSNLGEWHLLAGKLERLDPVHDLANLLRSFAGIAIFFAACTSFGIFVVRKIRIDNIPNSLTPFTRMALRATEFLIGYGLFSFIFLILGGLYQITPEYIILILLIGSLLGVDQIRNILPKAIAHVNFNYWWKREVNRNKAILLLAISIVLFSLLYSTARLSYDSTALYFSDAKLTAMTGHIQFFKDDAFAASAFQSTIQYTALIQVFGDQSARMLSWICGIIIIIFSIAVGERVGISRQARIILFTLLLTSTAFLDLMGDGKVDLLSSAPAMAAIYWMIVGSQSKTLNKSLLVLIGFLIGLAILGRPFNAFLMGLFSSLYYLQEMFFQERFEPFNYKIFTRSLLWIGVGAFAPGIYHLFANWMILGNPLAFLASVSSINPSSGPWDYDPKQILVLRLLYPFIITFRNSPQSLGNISPLFVAFLPALFMQDIRRKIKISKELFLLLASSIITLALWIFLFFTVTEIRYVIFLWAILFIPFAEAIANTLEHQDSVFQNILSGLIIILLLFNVWRTMYIGLDTYSPIDKNGNPQCYDSRFCQFLRPVNEVASPGDRILTLNAFRYYLRSDLFACSTKHQEYEILQELSHENNTAFWSEVYRQGYKYVLYENDYTTRHLQLGMIPDPRNVPDWINLKPLYGKPGDLQIAYEIQVKKPVIEVEFKCLKNASGIWEVKPILQ